MPRQRAFARELRRNDAGGVVGVVFGLNDDVRSRQAGADHLGDLFWVHGRHDIQNVAGPFGVALRRTATGRNAGNSDDFMNVVPDTSAQDEQLLTSARRALQIEANAVESLGPRLDKSFADACRVFLECDGRVVVTGIGKSGHIARKIAATFASTGTPSFFLHPAEASHGDLGMITRADSVLAISNSGETRELVLLLPHLKRLGVPLVTMTGNANSTLSTASTVVLDVSVSEEACPLNLAPTASTTATLAMGDALAVSLLEARGFTEQDFARSHPGGSLGRRLVLHVEDVMRKGKDLPRVHADTLLGEGLLEMSRKGLGMTVIVDDHDQVLGVFTDGDLRRTLDRQLDIHNATMREVMTINPKTIGPRELAAEGAHIMEQFRITVLPVMDSTGKLVGAFNVHDLLRAGVV
jgi:arabinose-5-phosphate isomerase